MEYRYQTIRTEYTDGGTIRTGYGIAAVTGSGDSATVIQSFADLCPDNTPVEQLVWYCNKLQLDIIHLPEVAEDFLTGL